MDYDTENSSSDDSEEDSTQSSRVIRFSTAQKACLIAHFNSGMTGVGKKHVIVISKAAKDTHLSIDQVKRWIKKKRHRRNHAKRSLNDRVLPTAKKLKLTPWQIFLKQFGNTEAGKTTMMAMGAAAFNKAASVEYNALESSEKEKLKELSATIADTDACPMSSQDIRRAATKIFKKIKTQYEELEKLGYQGVAFGFFEDDVQAVYTSDSACAVTPRIVDIIRSVIISGNLPVSTLLDKPPLSTKPPPSSTKPLPSSTKPPPSSIKPPPLSTKAPPSSIKPPPLSTKPPPSSIKSPTSIKPPPSSIKSPTSTKPPPSSIKPPPSSIKSRTSTKTPPSSIKPPTSTKMKTVPTSTLAQLLSSLPGNSDTVNNSSGQDSSSFEDFSPPDETSTSSNMFIPSHDMLITPDIEIEDEFASHSSVNNEQTLLCDPEEDCPNSPIINNKQSTSDHDDDSPKSPVILFQTSVSAKSKETIVISNSPVKDMADVWIPKFNLFERDLEIIKSDQWLNDAIIHAAQSLLRDQTKGEIFGWQSTQCSKRETLFSPLPSKVPFIQVLHIYDSHWIATSSVTRKGYLCDTVKIYDSGRPLSVSSNVMKQICSFYKCSIDLIHFDLK